MLEPKVREYRAVIAGRDMIRVHAVNVKDAVRQIAGQCDVNELFRIGQSVYRVNGKLAQYPATRIKDR